MTTFAISNTHALNIILNFESGKSDTPSFDPTGSGLQTLFQHAEDYYEDVIEDAHTITINYWYDNLSPASTIGEHELISQSGGRETEGDIRIDTRLGGAERAWFIDPTPADDSEFNMQQTFWSGLTGTQQTDFFSNFTAANIPTTFEIGWNGLAPVTSPANGIQDMLSTVMHEVGHALGMSASNNETQTETGDGDYDYNAAQIFGQSLAIETANNAGDDNLNIAHVENPGSLMSPGNAIGNRSLPSHSDIYAMAAVHNYVDIDVPRREYYGGSNWNNPGNWSGDSLPEFNDDVFVRNAQGAAVNLTANLNANGLANNLNVTNGANVDTNGFTLDVTRDILLSDTNSDIFVSTGGVLNAVDITVQNAADLDVSGELNADDITVQGAADLIVSGDLNADDVTITDAGSDLFIEPGGNADISELFIQNAAEVEMNGTGSLTVTNLIIDEGTQIEVVDPGTANVVVNGILINNGEIDTNNGGVFLFFSTESNPYDLDGDTDTGVVDASNGSISFSNGGLADPFDGTMRVGANHTITIAEPWTNSSGTIDLNGGATEVGAATINGVLAGTFSMTGGEMIVTGHALIDADTIFFGGLFNPQVTVGLDDHLTFVHETTVSGGTFTLGTLATIDFDLDTTVGGGTFEIGDQAVVSFNDNTTISGGTFNTPSSNGDDGRVVFKDTATYNGGTLTINGIARHRDDVTVDDATTINADVLDMDGNDTDSGITWTLNHELTINADNIDSDGNQFDGHITINHQTDATPGKLTINLPDGENWSNPDTSNIIINGKTTTFATTIDGSVFNLKGTAAIHDLVAWDARARLTGAVIINEDANLRILGGSIDEPYVFNGALISGLGTLSTIGDRALIGHGTLATDVTFFNEAELRAKDGTLTLSGQLNDVGTIGTDDETGTLDVTNDWNTNVTELVELRGGSLIGANLTNNITNEIQGHGLLAPNNLDNNGTIAATMDMTLTVNPDNNIDLDGTGETGQIKAIEGNLTIAKLITDPFDGEATVGPTRTLTFDTPWILGPAGDLDIDGGTTTNQATIAAPTQILFGSINANQEAHIQAPTTFKSTAQVTINDSNDALRLFEDATVEAGATFTGAGTLVNPEGSTLTIEDGATIGVELTNAGNLILGSSPGTASLAAFTQSTLGTLPIEIFIAIPPQNDRLIVTGPVTLAGTLDVIPLPDEDTADNIPLGSTFEILNYATRSGYFETITGTQFPANTAFAFAPLLNETTNKLILRATIPGDLNFDNIVSVADLAEFALNFDTTPGLYNETDSTNSWQLGDFNTDGAITITDLSLLALNFGFDATDPTATPTPLSLTDAAILAGIDPTTIPEPTTIWIAGITALLTSKRLSRSYR